jgi:hypothetical protein
MFYTMSSYQQYGAAEQRVCDVRLGEIAAGVRDLRLRLRRASRPRLTVRPARGLTAPAQVLPGR